MARYYLPATPLSCDCQQLISGEPDFYESLCAVGALGADQADDQTAQQIIGVSRGGIDILESLIDPGASERRAAAAASKNGGSSAPVYVGLAIAGALALGVIVMASRR